MKTYNKFFTALAVGAIFTQVIIAQETVVREIIEPTGLNQINEIIKNDERLQRKVTPEAITTAQHSIKRMNELIKEAIKHDGLANDGFISIADTHNVNAYLVEHYANEWYELRGINAEEASSGYYAVDRKGANTITLNTNAVSLWGKIYNLGFAPYYDGKYKKIADYTGAKSSSFESVGYYLGAIMKQDIDSGTLYNPDFKTPQGTTGTSLDQIVHVILSDTGLTKRISTSDMRKGAEFADKMNHLIVEAIIQEGLGNDATLSTADIRQINNYLVTKHQDKWAELHGDDEDGIETGYHLIQNDGASTRMFADNVINSVADGIYHLGFKTDKKYNLVNEDGNSNKSFEKVAFWLDMSLKKDLQSGAFTNPNFQEVHATTGTSFDKIVPFIYNDSGLLQKVSMQDIRVAAHCANEMNKLIVEAIRNTNVASDNLITPQEIAMLNTYLVENYAQEWIELHGDDEDDEESGYHRIQNDGAMTYMYNKNVINQLADGIYHLGFYTTEKNRLVDEDGKKNASFKSVAYWLNKSLQDDYEKGTFKKPFMKGIQYALNSIEKLLDAPSLLKTD